VGLKQLIFSWDSVSDASHYRLLENPDGGSGFTQVGSDIPAGTLSVSLPIAVHIHDFTNGLYMVEACNASGCTSSTAVNAMNGMFDAIGYFKASNAEEGDRIHFVTLSADGTTLAISALNEDSAATGVNGDQGDNSAPRSGAVYVFRFDGQSWSQEAYIKASNAEGSEAVDNNGITVEYGDSFDVVALSADGNTLAVGAQSEDSSATGVNGDQADNSAPGSGAVYVFSFDGSSWSQQAYIKASNPDGSTFDDNGVPRESGDGFGRRIALSADGGTLAVGAPYEESSAIGINGDQSDNSAQFSGAAYVFRFDGAAWSQQAYIKASNSEADDFFGEAVALSADGNTLAVGARRESSGSPGINGDQLDNSISDAGAVYVFRFDGASWSQQAYVKASTPDASDAFGAYVALSADGATMVVTSYFEDSNATGIDGDQGDNSATQSGAVYVFRFAGNAWSQEAFLKASNAEGNDYFGTGIALSSDGNLLAVAADREDGNANLGADTGAAYVFRFDGSSWAQQAYVRAPNADDGDRFGGQIAMSADGNTLVVSAGGEDSAATGINGDQIDNTAESAGAAYVY
jgi:hypothetical protein